MEELELDRINANSPYIVELDFSTDLFKFVSDFGVSFSVAFEKDELLQSGESYQFALTNYEGTKSPRDSKVRETVMCIVDEFFRKNQAALLYICETGAFQVFRHQRNSPFHPAPSRWHDSRQ